MLRAPFVACLCTASIWTGCASESGDTGSDGGEDGGANCSEQACVTSPDPQEWKGGASEYTARLLVVDGAGAPLEGVEVRVADRRETTGADGMAEVGPVNANDQPVVRAEREGLTPAVSRTGFFDSGQRVRRVTLTRVGSAQTFDVGERAVLAHGGALLEVPEQGLSRADGTRPERVESELTQFNDATLRNSGLDRLQRAERADGSPALMEDLLSVTYAHFRSERGEELNLAPGRVATLTVPIPDRAEVRVGDELPMWSLDEERGLWRRERDCVVARSSEEADAVCVGPASHFSYWAVARERDIYAPGSLGCTNVRVRAPEDACWKVVTTDVRLIECEEDGTDCMTDRVPRRTDALWGADELNACAVLPAGLTSRMQVFYHVDTSDCPEPDADAGADAATPPAAGRRLWLSPPVDLGDAFTDLLGAEVLLNFTLDPERDCENLCTQVVFEATEQLLADTSWVDADGDGYFTSTEGQGESDDDDDGEADPEQRELERWTERNLDCDDGDAQVHPFAGEYICDLMDRNCDGRYGPGLSAAPESYADLPAWLWNEACHCLPDSWREDEVRGNAYDEDCDGVVEDGDGDGFSARYFDHPEIEGPYDCHDLEPSIHPDAVEIAGNRFDENCDGARIDQDGDGMPAITDLIRVTDGAGAAGFEPEDFVDCNDYDARVNPRVDVSEEAGQLEGYYYFREDEWRRRESYCGLYDEDGEYSLDGYGRPLIWQSARDLNCDNVVTDADGDGFAGFDDLALGEELAIDCDDRDPRVGAASLENDELVCDVDLSMLLNDSTCTIAGQSFSAGPSCPVLTLGGVDLFTACEEATDAMGEGTGMGVCSYPGWWEGNPLTPNAGVLWGPCDGQPGDGGNQLPDCPSGSTCGGLMDGGNPWTSEFEAYVRGTYTDGNELAFRGTCFPACTVE